MDQHYRVDDSDFVWNARKAAANARKHGVRFEDAATVFMDPLFVLVDASQRRSARCRDRVRSVGNLLFVVHIAAEGDDCIRIISARPAEPAEETLYAQ